jgi:hypothetical protein
VVHDRAAPDIMPEGAGPFVSERDALGDVAAENPSLTPSLGPTLSEVAEAAETLERLLEAVATGSLVAPAGLATRLEGALVAMRVIARD